MRMPTSERDSWIARLLAPLAACAVCLCLVGCNTTEGFGRDVEAVGDNIEDAAQDAKD